MDRETAKRNLGSGLIIGAIAAGFFALAFVVATLYIASA
jgi:hypothetical protein